VRPNAPHRSPPHARADEVESLALGVGQVRRRIVMIGPATRDRALVEQNTPRRNSAHNVADLGAVDGLDQVCAGPGVKRLGQGLVVIE